MFWANVVSFIRQLLSCCKDMGQTLCESWGEKNKANKLRSCPQGAYTLVGFMIRNSKTTFLKWEMQMSI